MRNRKRQGLRGACPCVNRENLLLLNPQFQPPVSFRFGPFPFPNAPPELPGCTGTLIWKYRASSPAPDSDAISPLPTLGANPVEAADVRRRMVWIIRWFCPPPHVGDYTAPY